MKIYTRRGDAGDTSLFSGDTVRKDDLRVAAYGTIDELNSVLGLARHWSRDPRILEMIARLQNQLLTAGADLATPLESKRRIERIGPDLWSQMEGWIDELSGQLAPLKNFILPGGGAGAAQLHVARTVCRRAERQLVRLMDREEINRDLLIYLNRLSDLLFVMARYENAQAGVEDILWKG